MEHFSVSNPGGKGQGDVPALLRRVAASLERRGRVTVYDIVFHSETTEDEDDLTLTVYFERADTETGTDAEDAP